MKPRIPISRSVHRKSFDDRLFDAVAKADPGSNQQRLIDQLAQHYEGQLQDAFVAAINRMTSDVELQRLADAISAQDWALVEQLTGIEAYNLAIAELQNVMLDAFAAGGAQMAGLIASGQGIGPVSIAASFDRLNPAAIEAMRSISSKLASSLRGDTVGAVTRILQSQVATGQNPNVAAAQIKRIIGLNDQQAQALMNYEAALTSGKLTAAQGYSISGKDAATIAQASKKPLTQAQVSKLVENYRSRLLGLRAQTIAQTESMAAVSEGGAQAWTQAIAASGLPPENFRRFWVSTNDERTRPHHRAIPLLNAEGVGLNEPFKYPGGTIMRPHDPAAPASETIRCRCTQVVRYVPPTMIAPLPVVAGRSILPGA